VLSVEIAPGVVTAKVQGSRKTPYNVTIKLAPLSPDAWNRVITELAGRAIFMAKLLAGEMPAEIEEVFQAANAPLFPGTSRDLDTDCSCPDWSNPCKHIAAVYYLLGEEFDRDPFLIFTLRGLPRESLIDRLRAVAGDMEPETPNRNIPPEPLASDPTTFWSGTPLPTDFTSDSHPSAVTAPLLRRLGDFPFWRGTSPILTALPPEYAEAAQRGWELVLRCTADEEENAH
jgi:uncharacterized Zn finger protein